MIKTLLTTTLLVLVTGCATTSDIENLQGQINVIQEDQVNINKQLVDLKTQVADTNKKVTAAQQAAEKAAGYAETIDHKLQNFFKRSQYK